MIKPKPEHYYFHRLAMEAETERERIFYENSLGYSIERLTLAWLNLKYEIKKAIGALLGRKDP